MGNILQSLSKTVHASVILTILLFFGLHFFGDGFAFDRIFWSWLARYTHVIVATMWVGLLWYLNFVQIPSMPKLTDEQKPAITKVIAPAVLFWFRWAALFTFLTGVILLHQISVRIGTEIILGSTMGILMLLNVWGIIWPNQKIVLGLKEGDNADLLQRKIFVSIIQANVSRLIQSKS